METLYLTDKCKIWRKNLNQTEDQKSELIEYVKFNDSISKANRTDSVWIEIIVPCFTRVINKVKDHLSLIEGKNLTHYAEHFWIFTQKKGFNQEWLHQHIFVHPPDRSTVLSDYTFTYYIQTPSNSKLDEGCIMFQTEDKQNHKFLPQEGDLFIFPGDLYHTAIPTPDCDKDRIVLAGSICCDVNNQKLTKQSVI